MATLRLTFSDSTTLFRPSLPSTRTFSRNRSLIVKASSSEDDFSRSSRRRFIAETAALSVSLPQLTARSEDALSEWERVYLPIDPGVVLLDIAFVPDDPNHGIVNSQSPLRCVSLCLNEMNERYLHFRFSSRDEANHSGDERWRKHLGSAFDSFCWRRRFQLSIQFYQLQREGRVDCRKTCDSVVHFRCRRQLGEDTSQCWTSRGYGWLCISHS